MKRGDLIAAGFAVLGLGVAVMSQLPGRAAHRDIRETSDTYLLPPPNQVVKMSLGYRSATADILWANVLVTQGLRMSERRRFDIVVEYIDAINELDPKWRDPYKLADTLVTLQTQEAPLDQVRAARRILERGVRERPTDAELWLILGAYVAYIIPNNYLVDHPEEAEAWRRDGAQYLARAAELAPADSTIPWQTLGAMRIFSQIGQLDRAVELYNTILVTTEDPELRARVESHLQKLQEDRQIQGQQLFARTRRTSYSRTVRANYAGISPAGAALLGFPRKPSICAGGARAEAGFEAKCASSWSDWEKIDPSGGIDPSELEARRVGP